MDQCSSDHADPEETQLTSVPEQLVLHRRRNPLPTVADLERSRANALVRSTLRQETDLLSRAMQHHQEMIDDPAGRMRERFCMTLLLSAWCEEMNLPAVWIPYYAVTSMLPRLGFLGADIVNRMMARRRVNTPMVDTSQWSATGHPHAIGTLPTQPSEDGSQKPAIDARKRLLDWNADLDWVQRRQEAQELHAIVQDIVTTRYSSSTSPVWLPPSLHEMAARLAAHDGHLIYLVPDKSSCDVILFDGTSAKGPRTLHLPHLPIARLARLSGQLMAARAESRATLASTDTLRKMVIVGPRRRVGTSAALAELWEILVHPIIEAFGFQPTSAYAARRPRLWWCATGFLPLLPFHAAGVYTGPKQDNVGNYVVSSYTPTFPALYRVLNKKRTSVADREPRMLLVTHTAGGDLPYARVEAEAIRSVVPPQYLVGSPAADREPTVQAALAALPHASILHLACHGHQDLHEPMNSGFDLADGRLTLAQLMRVRSPEHAQLAYLSACESAANDKARPEEGLNLAATMLLAGFKSVVATMWSMNDVDGPFIAERVYRSIFRSGQLDLASVPFALHDAVRELRESGVPASRWATYVHVGG